MDRGLVSKILLIAAVVCAVVAWFAAVGWVDNFDAFEWSFASLAAYFTSVLVEKL